MTKEFYKIFQGIFPYNVNNIEVKDFLSQFEDTQFQQLLMDNMSSDFEINSVKQGDIFENIPITRTYLNSNNKLETNTIKEKAMLISNSCDAERRHYVLFAPVLPLSNYNHNKNIINSIKKNEKASAIYIGDTGYQDSYIDISATTSLELKAFKYFLENKKIVKKDELNQYGYYLLLAKISHFLVRPESDEVFRYD
ncbi:hypothetical protein [Mammaliicoccus sciuri]|uniref:hypothetical protein n=1 Tax=Mammaliicoccus sciuri TaxID=1296 RepID=UPI002B25CB90|nr:hypothetical protein [Mammaliicoccus sciuri]WQK73578.1 hypothetical protein P3U33_12135 [Mammaliicoccus sciuri]